MKSPWIILALSLLLASHAFAEAPRVKVYVRLYELSGDAAPGRNPSLRKRPKTDELILQPFEMASGKVAEASVERTFVGGSRRNDRPNVGVYLTIRPTLKGERIAVSIDSKQVEYVGPRAGSHGAFEIRKRSDMRGSTKYGEPVRFDLGIRKDERSVMDERTGRTEVVTVPRRMVATLTFTRV